MLVLGINPNEPRMIFLTRQERYDNYKVDFPKGTLKNKGFCLRARNAKIKKRSILEYVSTFHFGNDAAIEQKGKFSGFPNRNPGQVGWQDPLYRYLPSHIP